jgi:Zinc knuckle
MASLKGAKKVGPPVDPKAKPPEASTKKRNPSVLTDDTPATEDEENGGEFRMQRRSSRKMRKRLESLGTSESNTKSNEGRDQPPNPNFTNVYLEATDKRRLNDFAVARQLRKAKIDFARIIAKGHSQILIRFSTKAAALELVNNESFHQSFKCTANISEPKLNGIRGVIHKVDTDMTEEEITEELKRSTHFLVTKVTRINRTNVKGEKIPTNSVIIEFSGLVLPRSVGIYNVSRRVDVYVSKPTLCYNCQTYGHIARQCNSSRPVCGYCSERHNTADCTQQTDNAKPTCINCKGPHRPNSMECPVMQHKFQSRLQSSLQRVQFQPIPANHFNTEFPVLQNQNDNEDDTTVQEERQPHPEPKILSRSARTATVKKFNEAIKNRYYTDNEKFEKRQTRYQNILNLPRATRQNKPQSHQSAEASLPRLQGMWATPRQPQMPPRFTPSRPSDTQIKDLTNQLLANKKALTLILSALNLLVSTLLTPNDNIQEENLQDIRESLQNMLKNTKSHLVVPSETESDMEDE